jgi:tRNA(Ile2)-agmatinylcytidine synthase
LPRLHIGIDDTDSKRGMCTTYLAAVLAERLQKEFKVRLIDRPRLIRLNPSCPYKTRGNAALALTIDLPARMINKVKDFVLLTVPVYAELGEKGTEPGVAFLEGEISPEISYFSSKTVRQMVSMNEALGVAKRTGAELHRFGYGRGIIGALAAIGNRFEHGSTFELIAYRTPEKRGTKREIDPESVIRMDKETRPFTFDNVDYSTNEIRIMPHTPCPVYFGIRGTNIEKLEQALRILKPFEPIERYIIFRTNQGTDAHIVPAKIATARLNSAVKIEGRVSAGPDILRGGHIKFELKDKTGSIDCIAYEPTKGFRSTISKLIVGDMVEVFGAVKKRKGLPKTVNLEKIIIKELARKIKLSAPRCPVCRNKMKSEGRAKGYQCPRCKHKEAAYKPIPMELKREIVAGVYTVPPRARRHLSRPHQNDFEI